MSETLIEGFVERYKRYNNNFYILKILTNKEEYKTVTGNTELKIEEHQYYQFTVQVKMHPKYGKQYNFTNLEEKQPQDKGNIIKIFQRNFKGVGKKTATIIYDTLGEDALKSLLLDPKLIFTVPVKQNIKDTIYQHFNDINNQNEQLIKLQEMGLSYTESFELFTQLKELTDNVVNEVKQNPYIIRTYLRKVGFIKCDFIAKKIGFPRNHPIRLEECISHLLMEAEQSGDVCIEINDFFRKMQIFLSLPIVEIKSIIQNIELSKEVAYEYYDEFIYSKRTGYIETNIAYKLRKIHRENTKFLIPNIDEEITLLEDEEKLKNKNFKGLHHLQREAIKYFFQNNFSLLSGGPGTGKTTILRFIIRLCKKFKISFILCAPTGMASKKMSISTSEKAKTIHRTLECDMSTGVLEFLRNENNFLSADVIIIDECSMIDMYLFFYTLKAIDVKTKVMLVGDPDQLPSVGPGKILNDLIEANVFPHVHLEKIYRQGKNSMIVENAYRINNEEPLLLKPDDDLIRDFFFIQSNNDEKVAEIIKDLVNHRLESYKTELNKAVDIQILTPRKEGLLGVFEYNKTMQQVLNPPHISKREIIFKNKFLYREGDKVMQLFNNIDKDIYNGDIGFIKSIQHNEIIIDYSIFSDEEKIISYTLEELDEIILAYCCTVHKSQGSEYKIVIMPIIQEDYMMLYKKLVYTAITRGKEMVILVGDISVLNNNLYTRRDKTRITNLKKKLVTIYENEALVA